MASKEEEAINRGRKNVAWDISSQSVGGEQKLISSLPLFIILSLDVSLGQLDVKVVTEGALPLSYL